jgi:hypothetical protein
MANTYEIIDKATVGSGGAASITFTSIPATYTDLILFTSTRGTTGGNTNVGIKFNNSTTGFTGRRIYAENTTVASDVINRWAGFSNGTNTSNTFCNTSIYIPNYASSNNKSYSVDTVAEDNGTGNIMAFGAHVWANSAAINEITITPDNAYSEYSSAYLYGIKNS